MDEREPKADATQVPPRTVAVTLAIFWGVFVAMNTIRALALGFPHQGGALIRRLFVAMIGAVLAWVIYRILAWRRDASAGRRVAMIAGLSLPAALIFGTANFLIFDVFLPLPGDTCINGHACTLGDAAVAISTSLINWSFVFASWGLLYSAMASAARTRAADRLASGYREAARLAEVRALRYQVNPHFLFNVLNSLGALVRRKDSDEAEQLIGEIGRFFRHSLSIDPVADTMLAEEFDMQLRYLAIERHRFPDRLTVETEIDDAVGPALVPSLILQPLVENAIKHGVGRTLSPVRIVLRAGRTDADRLRITVEDDADSSATRAANATDAGSPDGLGVGLRNVADRLAARFGPAASMTACALPGRGFQVELVMPLELE